MESSRGMDSARIADEVARRRQALQRRIPQWVPTSLAGRLDTVAAAHPDRPCVITEARTYTYSDIQSWSRRLARGLLARGVEPREHVALLVDNRPELVAVKLAVARVDAVAVPLNFQYRGDELREALARSDAAVLVTIDASMATNFIDVLDRSLPGWEDGPQDATLPHLRQVVLVPTGVRSGALDLNGLAELGASVPEGTLRRREDAVSPSSVCDIVFTSGTTGHALGAMLTHDMVLRSAYGSAYARAFADGWRSVFSLPLYHVFGYVEGLLATWFAGGAIAPLSVFNPKSVLHAIEAHRAHEALFVPTMTVAVVEHAAGFDLSSLTSVFSAAAPAPVWLWERVYERLGPDVVFTGYGQTEVSAATALTMPGDPVETVASTVGREKPGGVAGAADLDGRLAEYRTVDPFTGSPLPDGSEGELAVRGPIVTGGYYNEPQRSVDLIDPAGWLRTGDLGRIRDDRYIELTGRASELYKCGGELVAPKEVEDLLTEHPGVAQAYVAGVPDDRFGEVGWAWVVPDERHPVTARELTRHCHDHLASFKVPRQVRFLAADELPTTATGKVQKFRLAETAAQSPD